MATRTRWILAAGAVIGDRGSSSMQLVCGCIESECDTVACVSIVREPFDDATSFAPDGANENSGTYDPGGTLIRKEDSAPTLP